MRSILRILEPLFLTAIIVMGFMPASARAATINVPADQSTIQAAINAASNGDTVLVAPGTYYENIDFMGKAITVTSSGGPSVTTINGGGIGAVATFDTNEGNNSVLSGFTITNGLGGTDPTGTGGGGIQINSASPTITGNVITNNSAGTNGEGAGIHAMASSALIQGNVIRGNHGEGRQGGGVFIGESGSVQLIGNQITGNTGFYGGGVAVNPTATPTIKNNTISGNTAAPTGVGTPAGGGLFLYGYALVVQNLITGNSAPQGGGVYLEGEPAPVLVNNTIANNNSPGGSGIYVYEDPYVQSQLTNNLIIGSAGQTALYCDGAGGGLAPTVQWSDAFSAGGTGFGGNCAGMAGTNGNLSVDPLFLDSSADFHLQSGSPAIDAGDNSAPDLSSTDLDGNTRIVDGNNDGTAVVDMGAYEFYPATDTVSPASLTFGSQQVGTTSPAQTVTVTNSGSKNLLLSISADANFAETNNCGSVVAPGAGCSINVTFTPTTSGTLSGNLTIRSNATRSPQSVALSGNGLGPVVGLTPSSLDFGSLAVGASNTLDATLTNNSGSTLTISSVAVTGTYYTETNLCGSSLSPASSCTIEVTFNPGAAGTWTGSLTVTDNASNSPQTASLSGSATGPTVTLSPASVAFGNQPVGTTSAAQSVTLSNTGNATLSISGISATAGFAQSNTCGTSLAANASCAISVTFSPATAGSQTGEISVADNASGSPQSVALSGTGTAPAVALSPSSVSFGAQQLGTTSAAQTVTLTNSGNAPLSISSIATNGDFAETNNCGASVAAGASCSIGVTFSPTASGTRTGTLAVADNASTSPQTVSLSGDGSDFTLSAAPSSITVKSGKTAQYTVTVSAAGGAFNSAVGLSCSGLPSASTCQFLPASVTPGSGSASSVMTIQTTRGKGKHGTPSGSYPITITGVAGSLEHSTAVTLVVR